MATPWQICHWCQRCTLSCEYFREFSNKFEPALMGYSGAWGKMFHEKNMKSKISWHCPFKLPFACTKLYKVKSADSRCHSWPTGNYVSELNLLKGPPTHTHRWRKYILRGEGRDFTCNTAEMFSFGPNPTRAKKPSPLLLVYFMTTSVFRNIWNLGKDR